MTNLKQLLQSIKKRIAIHGSCAIQTSARQMSARSLFHLIFLLTISLLLLTSNSHSVELTKYQAEGDCYELTNRYLKTLNIAFIISDDLKGKSCNWNFQGNIQKDFNVWCNKNGFICGGNPFYVGRDSVWYNGEFIPHERAKYLKRIETEQKNEKSKQDSLFALLNKKDSLLDREVTIEYLEIGKSTADKLGFEYSEYIGSAKFVHYTDLFSVMIQAKNLGDTTFVYRSYTSVYDSTLKVFWGGQRDRLTQSNVTANGIVSNNYTQEQYGMEFEINDMRYRYKHSTDYEHSITGEGKLHYGRNDITGVYQYTYTRKSYLPILGNIPIIGFIFSHILDETETRYILIQVYLM